MDPSLPRGWPRTDKLSSPTQRFGDIHYFYGPETQSPRHHRFDKDSYVYLFENANEGRARLEIANNPGTDDQDAFDGRKFAPSGLETTRSV